MRSTALEAIFKKNKTFRKTNFSKKYFGIDRYAHKFENPLSQPHILKQGGELIAVPCIKQMKIWAGQLTPCWVTF